MLGDAPYFCISEQCTVGSCYIMVEACGVSLRFNLHI